jgi:carboxymethylenebutenolidase
MDRPQASEFPQELLDLYDDYAHGRIERRDFLQRASKFAIAGVTVEMLLSRLSPTYAWAQQVAKDDPKIVAEHLDYDSPQGGGKMHGYLVRPADIVGKLPAVLVIHENRGLNPYIEDVTRRLGAAGFLAFAPDALAPLGGYPGNDDKGREMQAQRDRNEMVEDFVAAAKLLKDHKLSNGQVGVVGFCFGGGLANTMAVRLPDIVIAAASFYGAQPSAEDTAKIKAELLLHYAEHDGRINEGWPAHEAALKASGVKYTIHMYDGVYHGFHNDTTPRYDEAAAKLAWQRTIDFFNRTLR